MNGGGNAQAQPTQDRLQMKDEVVQLINILISKLNILIQARQNK